VLLEPIHKLDVDTVAGQPVTRLGASTRNRIGTSPKDTRHTSVDVPPVSP
jgi:hypothetical protein